MKTVLAECAKILGCTIKQLYDKMGHPLSRDELLMFLKGRRVRTTYDDLSGNKKCFTIGGITRQRADSLPAYGRLSRIFNVTVAQHFYSRHRIRLRHPYLPCIIEQHGPNSVDRYYPLELLEFEVEEKEKEKVTDDDVKKPNGLFVDEKVERLFKEIDNEDRKDIVWEEEDQITQTWGRDECSQSISSSDNNSSLRCHHYGGPIDCTSFLID